MMPTVYCQITLVSAFAVVLAQSVGCASIPSGVRAVEGFDLERYLGRWYEIARLDHSFERGLTHVTAEYSLRDDGRIRVVNRGFDTRRERWRQSEASARRVGDGSVASLRVSFFPPFSAAYHVIALDQDDYRYAMVTSSSRSFLWVLAREPELEPEIIERLTEQARKQGFAVDQLIWVDQTQPPPPDS